MLPDLQKLIEALYKHQVEFIIVGGMAAVAQGAPVTTFDLDICYRRTPENHERLAAALSPFNPTLRGAPEGLPFVFDAKTLSMGCNFTLSTDAGDIDLLGELTIIGSYEALEPRAQTLDIFGFPVKVMHLRDLILVKEAIGRLKDRAVLEVLKETLRLSEEEIGGNDALAKI